MRRYFASALAVSLAISLWAVVGAQSGVGQIRGVVHDRSGVALPGVEVSVVSGSIVVRTMHTDAQGEFSAVRLDPGHYEVRAALTGFETSVASVDIGSGQIKALSIVLGVAPLEETATAKSESLPSSDAAAANGGVRDGVGVGGGRGIGPGSGGGSGMYQTPSAAPVDRINGLGRGQFNTEAYDKIDDTQWTDVAHKPLSTFSVDVDTASYANVRRFLNQGQMPPKDAVRIEELINYFSYDYPEPRDGKPFSVTTAIDVCPWDPHHRLALVGLQAKRLDADHVPPRNLVFLIDVSGSMLTPQKLPLVKASLAMLAPNLTDKDRVAIVVYAGAAGLVLPSTSGADAATILDAIGRLQGGGSTNGGQGLRLAYDVAEEHLVKNGVNRVVLATDGDFNVGVTNQGDLLRLIEEKRESGVTLSVLGFGMGNLKDSTMEKLADRGNGNYSYIDTLAEAQKVLVEQAGGTLVTVAKDVKLQIEFNPRVVAAYRLVGYENRVLQDQDFNNDRKDAGDMGAGHSVTALYEIVPAGERVGVVAGERVGAVAGERVGAPAVDSLKYQRPGALAAAAARDEAMTVGLRYKQPDADISSFMSVAVPSRARPTPELGFSAAVAEFGMLLRESEFRGHSSFADVRTRANTFKGNDPHGHRAEFIRLVDAAESVGRLNAHIR